MASRAVYFANRTRSDHQLDIVDGKIITVPDLLPGWKLPSLECACREQDRQRAERLAEMLKAQGIDPDALAE